MFDKAFELIIGLEGGYSNNKNDPGGETKFGISKRSYPDIDIPHLTLEKAKEIYLKDYWNACHCDSLPWPLSVFVFDAAVNQGTDPAIRMLQRALDTTQDGIIGSVTSKLASESRKWHWARFLTYRAQRYNQNLNANHFGEGWLIRIFTLAMEAIKEPTVR